MRCAAQTTSGLLLAGMLVLGGCGAGEDAASPAAAPQPAPAPPVEETAEPIPEEPLRTTEPDPEVLGVEGTLPGDVPVPEGAQAMHPPLVASGTTRATFEVGEPLASVRSFYKTRLESSGWSIDAEKELESQLLMSAKKGERELSVAMSETDGRTQLVLLLVGG
jgi:hypothetical protein